MHYRGDIDGLRAIAVLSVILFHFNIEQYFAGGYVGVDIFFVISGYLITSIIYNDISTNKYSIARFYQRRIRRIFPALFFLFLCCLIASFLLQFPSEANYTGRSIVSSIFFVSNIYFSDLNGYFDHRMEGNPVLHTWSLSVEEQYYLFFPPLVYALKTKKKQTQLLIIFTIAAASLLYSSYQVKIDTNKAFYLVQYRAWELLLGALLAIQATPKLKQQWLAELLALLGLAMIFSSIYCFSRSTQFPGPTALLPCLGAAIILYVGSQNTTLVSRAISCKPIQYVGRISYSLYLWHWPIWVFAKQIYIPKDLNQKAILISLCFAISSLSWRYIEEPFRRGRLKASVKPTLTYALATMLGFASISTSIGLLSEKYYNYPARVENILNTLNYDADLNMRAGKCFLTAAYNSFSNFNQTECLTISSEKKNVLIIGDSHAAHLWPGLASSLPQINFLQATASGCKPTLDSKGEKRCTDLIKFIFNDFLNNKNLDAIILSARWQQKDVQAAIETATWLKKYSKRIIISGPINEYHQPLPRLLANIAAKNEDEFRYLDKYRNPTPAYTDAEFSNIKLPSGISYISTYKAMSSPNWKVWASDGTPVQFDYGHLTKQGAELLIKSTNLASQLNETTYR